MALSLGSSSNICNLGTKEEPLFNQLRAWMEARISILINTGEALAGLYRRGTEEYVVLSGLHPPGERCFFIIADKLLPFAGNRALLLAILNRLNFRSLYGIHQLIELPCGVIYLYKQVLYLQGTFSDELFNRLLEEGTNQFSEGIRKFCRELDSGLTGLGKLDGSNLAAERN